MVGWPQNQEESLISLPVMGQQDEPCGKEGQSQGSWKQLHADTCAMRISRLGGVVDLAKGTSSGDRALNPFLHAPGPRQAASPCRRPPGQEDRLLEGVSVLSPESHLPASTPVCRLSCPAWKTA